MFYQFELIIEAALYFVYYIYIFVCYHRGANTNDVFDEHTVCDLLSFIKTLCRCHYTRDEIIQVNL